jgi:lipopolysaccharide export system permease protein
MRLAFPFSTFILTLIGVSLSSRKTRGGIGIHVATGIVLSFTYILLMQFSKEFAISGSIGPVIATWIPNILFLIIGLVLYRIAPK